MWYCVPQRVLWKQISCHLYFKFVLLHENYRISIEISLKVDEYCSSLVQATAGRRKGAKPLYEPLMTMIIGAIRRHYGQNQSKQTAAYFITSDSFDSKWCFYHRMSMQSKRQEWYVRLVFVVVWFGLVWYRHHQLLLTWVNSILSMDKYSQAQWSVGCNYLSMLGLRLIHF